MASFKMYLTSVLSLFLGIIFSVNALTHVPVLLWESNNVGAHDNIPAALSKMSMEEFADVLVRRVDSSDSSPVVVLFSEETLSVEDFSRQSAGSLSPFPALQSIKQDVRLEFIPAVQTPVKALNRLSKLGYKWEQLSGEVLPEDGKKIIVVDLGDLKLAEDRSAMLLRHDKHIAALFKQMEDKYKDVLAIYTGRHSSWTTPESSFERVRRDAEPTKAPGEVCNTVLTSAGSGDQIMLYTSECPLLTVNNNSNIVGYALTPSEALAPDTRKGSQRMTVRYMSNSTTPDKVTIRFRFNFTDDGYWRLTQAEYEGYNNQYILDSMSDIRAPNNVSYSCGSTTIFQNKEGTVTLKLKNIKVQPGVSGGVFAASADCVPFFTIPIWSGLFVTFLLLFIVAWGIDMMMSIHTMDRFDDPKGKPLVFNAQE